MIFFVDLQAKDNTLIRGKLLIALKNTSQFLDDQTIPVPVRQIHMPVPQSQQASSGKAEVQEEAPKDKSQAPSESPSSMWNQMPSSVQSAFASMQNLMSGNNPGPASANAKEPSFIDKFSSIAENLLKLTTTLTEFIRKESAEANAILKNTADNLELLSLQLSSKKPNAETLKSTIELLEKLIDRPQEIIEKRQLG